MSIMGRLEEHYQAINDCITRGGALRTLYAELQHVCEIHDLEGVGPRITLLIEEINHLVGELHGISSSLTILGQALQKEGAQKSGAV